MRKRSKYKPKGVRLDNLAYLLKGFEPLSKQPDAVVLDTKNHSALAELAQGRGTKHHVDVVIAALNMTEALYLVRAELGADWSAEIKAGQDALFEMAKRGNETGRFIFKGPELTAVNLAMSIHDEQLKACTVAELEKALEIERQAIINRKVRVI
jgi:hypothetical protein